jgi:hypothetical protein
LALLFACVAFVVIAAGSVYYANRNAQRRLNMIAEQDFDDFVEDCEAEGGTVVAFPVSASAAAAPCVHCGVTLATPRDQFCRKCGTEQPERTSSVSSSSSPLPAAAVAVAGGGSSHQFCRNCGKSAKNASDKFCWHCGTPAPATN